jgi:hypothetical protein
MVNGASGAAAIEPLLIERLNAYDNLKQVRILNFIYISFLSILFFAFLTVFSVAIGRQV